MSVINDRVFASTPSGGCLLGEQAELERKLHVFSAMCEAELLLDALLVRVHRLRADEEALANLRRGVALCNEAKHVALSLCQRFVAIALRLHGILAAKSLDQDAGRARADVRVPVRHRANSRDELTVGRALDEIPVGAGLHERHEVFV